MVFCPFWRDIFMLDVRNEPLQKYTDYEKAPFHRYLPLHFALCHSIGFPWSFAMERTLDATAHVSGMRQFRQPGGHSFRTGFFTTLQPPLYPIYLHSLSLHRPRKYPLHCMCHHRFRITGRNPFHGMYFPFIFPDEMA